MKRFTLLSLSMVFGISLLTACSTKQAAPVPQAGLPNPASVFCEQQGYTVRIVTAADGSQGGECVFPDGSVCDEWAFFRGECSPAAAPTTGPSTNPTEIPTQVPFGPSDYQGWWTYTHPMLGFTILLPEDWIVEEVTVADPMMNGHTLTLRPERDVELMNIRLTFRQVGEDIPLWPTGIGSGELKPEGTLDISGLPAQRVLFICPSGEISSIYYHQAEGQPNIQRGNLEFGFIFSYPYCQAGYSLGGKVQRLGEMIIASLQVP